MPKKSAVPRRGVQYRYFPVIAVVKLSEPRRYQRNGRQGGYLEGIPEKRTVAVERGIGPSLQAFHLTALTCRERSQAVGHCQGVGDRHRKRIGTARRQYACSQRVGGFPDHRQQRIGGYDDFGIRIGRAFFAARNPVCVLTQFRQGERRVLASFLSLRRSRRERGSSLCWLSSGALLCRRGAWGRRAYGPLRTHIPASVR